MSQLFKKCEYLSTVDSTNDHLKNFIHLRKTRMVVANEQTRGKGRYGRSWFSPAGEGLYISYLLYPGWSVERSIFLNMISIMAVVKVIRRIRKTAPGIQIKEPNDVLVGGKKVCGVLTETGSLNDRINWAIVGIGINLSQKKFPPNLRYPATSLAREGVAVGDVLEFGGTVTFEFEKLYRKLEVNKWKDISLAYENEDEISL